MLSFLYGDDNKKLFRLFLVNSIRIDTTVIIRYNHVYQFLACHHMVQSVSGTKLMVGHTMWLQPLALKQGCWVLDFKVKQRVLNEIGFI